MFSLIITVQSIAMNANLVLAHLSKQYAAQTETQLEQDADYAIPSLIWPPPSKQSNVYPPRTPHYPPIITPRCPQQRLGDSLWLLH